MKATKSVTEVTVIATPACLIVRDIFIGIDSVGWYSATLSNVCTTTNTSSTPIPESCVVDTVCLSKDVVRRG